MPLSGRERAGGHGLEAFGNDVSGTAGLPGGNTLIATSNGHPVIEVLWTFGGYTRFGNSVLNTQLLDVGTSLR